MHSSAFKVFGDDFEKHKKALKNIFLTAHHHISAINYYGKAIKQHLQSNNQLTCHLRRW